MLCGAERREVGRVSKKIVKEIEEYFKKHPDLEWFFGGKKLNAEETIRLLKKDKKFRKMLVKAVLQFKIEQVVEGKV